MKYAAVLLGEVFGRYKVYDYCMQRLESMEVAEQCIKISESFMGIKDSVVIRCPETTDA